jgi:RimJ/RimL family protein N-acetyltransferase
MELGMSGLMIKKSLNFLGMEIFPISREQQATLIENENSKASSLVLAITSNETGSAIGMVSLKSIDHIQRVAEIAIVLGPDKVRGAALEAIGTQV